MRIPRLHVDRAIDSAAGLTLESERAHYLKNVMRLKPGAELSVFDGRGTERRAVVERLERHSVVLELGDRVAATPESGLRITLVQGLSRGERMDYTVQKATELGVHRIVPLAMARSGVKLDGPRRDKKLDHWRGVAASACEQCGRATLPEVTAVRTLDEWLCDDAEGRRIFLDPESGQGLKGIEPGSSSVAVLIGPEGGIDPLEHRKMMDAGCIGVRLGPRILRTETAGPAVIAALQVNWGDLG